MPFAWDAIVPLACQRAAILNQIPCSKRRFSSRPLAAGGAIGICRKRTDAADASQAADMLPLGHCRQSASGCRSGQANNPRGDADDLPNCAQRASSQRYPRRSRTIQKIRIPAFARCKLSPRPAIQLCRSRCILKPARRTSTRPRPCRRDIANLRRGNCPDFAMAISRQSRSRRNAPKRTVGRIGETYSNTGNFTALGRSGSERFAAKLSSEKSESVFGGQSKASRRLPAGRGLDAANSRLETRQSRHFRDSELPGREGPQDIADRSRSSARRPIFAQNAHASHFIRQCE